MNSEILLEQLLELLESQNIQIRKEPLGGSGGGLCNLKGQKIFFVDTDSPATEVAAICAEAISQLIDIDTIYLRPEVRQFIEAHAKKQNH